MSRRNALGRMLDPPPGGTREFRRRLEAQREPKQSAARFAPAVLFVVAAIVLYVAIRLPSGNPEPKPPDIREATEFDRLLGRPLDRTEISVSVNDQRVDIAELTPPDAKVRIYRIEGD